MNTRRDFLKISALASCSFLMPKFLFGLPDQLSQTLADGRKLIILQLSGGNDGLNTVVPYSNDLYFNARPRLALSEGEIIPLTDDLAFHSALEALYPWYDDGYVSILNSVGYPNPDRSHFRSMDIWHTASQTEEYWETGWLGRYLDACCGGTAPPHQLIEADESLSLALKGERVKGMALTDPRALFQATDDEYLRQLATGYASGGDRTLDYLYKTMTETMQSAAYIHEQAKIYKTGVTYPWSPFSKNLKLIAELIGSGIESTVFYAELGSFDTHIGQRGQQQRLLKMYADGVAAMLEDLKQTGNLDRTLILTFSEFGRRVEQNASAGTDHGKANVMFLMGGGLRKPGIFNASPDLARLDDGDVTFDIDFRQVYATVLRDWLGADDAAILKRKFDRLGLV